MISVQDAVAAAQKYLSQVLGQVPGQRVEEVESRDDSWLITLSFIQTLDPMEPRKFGERSSLAHRSYKVFEVRKSTGEVVAMKIRMLQDA